MVDEEPGDFYRGDSRAAAIRGTHHVTAAPSMNDLDTDEYTCRAATRFLATRPPGRLSPIVSPTPIRLERRQRAVETHSTRDRGHRHTARQRPSPSPGTGSRPPTDVDGDHRKKDSISAWRRLRVCRAHGAAPHLHAGVSTIDGVYSAEISLNSVSRTHRLRHVERSFRGSTDPSAALNDFGTSSQTALGGLLFGAEPTPPKKTPQKKPPPPMAHLFTGRD